MLQICISIIQNYQSCAQITKINVSQTYNNPVSLPLVLGPMAPTELGMTLTHEHLILDYSTKIMKPRYVPDNLRDLILKMENLGKIRHFR